MTIQPGPGWGHAVAPCQDPLGPQCPPWRGAGPTGWDLPRSKTGSRCSAPATNPPGTGWGHAVAPCQDPLGPQCPPWRGAGPTVPPLRSYSGRRAGRSGQQGVRRLAGLRDWAGTRPRPRCGLLPGPTGTTVPPMAGGRAHSLPLPAGTMLGPRCGPLPGPTGCSFLADSETRPCQARPKWPRQGVSHLVRVPHSGLKVRSAARPCHGVVTHRAGATDALTSSQAVLAP